MQKLLFMLFVTITRTASQCDKENSVELKNRMYNGVRYKYGEYFVDNVTKVERGCVCMKEVCARKCCPFGQIYHQTKRQCLNVTAPFNPPVRRRHRLLSGYNASKELHFLFGKRNCSDELQEIRVPVAPATKDFHLTTDGNLYVEIPNGFPSVIIYGPDKYCIDTFISEKVKKPHLNALICFKPKEENNHYGVSSSCMLISCFFILVTVAVYAWLPELRNLHGMVLMAYLLSFFVGFLFLATMQILILKDDISQDTCTVLTFIIYYSLLAAFFWLNVMCYDIWWTFSGKRAHGRSGSQIKRFIYYSIYAFGVPTVLTINLAILEFADLPLQHALLPKLRLQGCFLYGNSKLLYLYGPIVLLCVANMTFFGLTAFKIWKIKKETKMLRGKESSTHDQERNDTQRFGLYVKLFTVMGINWILEVISSFYPEGDFIWQFSDAYNVLVGLIIFIIFVCKKKTWTMIKKRYRHLRGDPMSRTQTTMSSSTRTHSTSRDDMQMNSIKKKNVNPVINDKPTNQTNNSIVLNDVNC